MELVDGNRIALLQNGAEYFPALIAACDEATREIHLESYIFEGDGTRPRGRGGARAGGPARGLDLPASGRLRIQVLSAKLMRRCRRRRQRARLPAEHLSWKLKRSRLRRLHRKLAMSMRESRSSAGSTSWTTMHAARGMPPRFDYAVRVEGPLFAPIVAGGASGYGGWSRNTFRSRRPRDARVSMPDVAPRGEQRRSVADPRQPAAPPRHRGRLPRGHRRLALGDPDRQRVFLSRRLLPARADRTPRRAACG